MYIAQLTGLELDLYQAIVYADQQGAKALRVAFNQAIKGEELRSERMAKFELKVFEYVAEDTLYSYNTCYMRDSIEHVVSLEVTYEEDLKNEIVAKACEFAATCVNYQRLADFVWRYFETGDVYDPHPRQADKKDNS